MVAPQPHLFCCPLHLWLLPLAPHLSRLLPLALLSPVEQLAHLPHTAPELPPFSLPFTYAPCSVFFVPLLGLTTKISPHPGSLCCWSDFLVSCVSSVVSVLGKYTDLRTGNSCENVFLPLMLDFYF